MMFRRSTPSYLRNLLGKNDRGVALPMVLMVFLVGIALVGAFLVAVVASAQVSTTTRSSVQAEAAAEAGIAAALAQIDPDDLCGSATTVQSSSNPVYEARVEFRRGSDDSWATVCPSEDAEMRVLSIGHADSVTARIESVYDVWYGGGGSMLTGGVALRTSLGMGLSGGAKITSANPSVGPADIFVESGDFICTAGAEIEGSIFVADGNVEISGNCPISGDLIASGSVRLAGSGSVGGSVVSVNGDVTFDGGSSVGGNIYAGRDLKMPQGKILGNAYALRHVAFSGGAPKIEGSLEYGGTVSMGWGSISTWVKGSAQKRSVNSIPTGPPVPALPEWIDVAVSDISSTYTEREWEGSCGVPSYPLHTFFATDIPGLENPTLINALNCDELRLTESGGQLSISTDIVLVAKAFYLNNVQIRSADGQPHTIWFVVPTDAQCAPGGTAEIVMNNTVRFPDGRIRALAYSPCEIEFKNAGNDPWPGMLYTKRFSGYAAIKYEPIDLPIPGSATPNPENPGGGGVPLYLLSSRESGVDLSFGLVEAAGSEHGVEHVATSACERDDGLVVAFALSNFPVVIGA